jgi:hypothetical protein
MKEIEDGTVVSGEVDVDGNLILTHHDGSTVNAGYVVGPMPTMLISYRNAASAPSTYPLGLSYMPISAIDDWPIDTAILFSVKSAASNRMFQQLVDKETTRVWMRSENTGDTWIAWREITGDATSTVKGLVELATLGEMTTGTSQVLAATPEGVRQERNRVSQFTGIIEAGWSGGQPNVVLDAGQAYSGTVQAILPPNEDQSIKAGARVVLTITNGGFWTILSSYGSKPKFMRQIPGQLEPGSGWVMYTDTITTDPSHTFGEGPAAWGGAAIGADSSIAGNFYITCTSTGIVSLMGLINRAAGNPAVNSIIGRFPISLAPARNQFFGLVANNLHAQVAICTDGTIRYLTGAAASYFSLNGIQWRTAASVTAGLATFVPLTLISGWGLMNSAAWTGEPGSTIHTPGYTIDGDKVAIFEGIVGATVAKAALADISVLSGLTPAMSIHCHSAFSGGFNYIRIGGSAGAGGVGNTLNLGIAIAAGGYMSLANVLWLDSSSTTTKRVVPGISGVNGWTNYGATQFAPANAAKTPDGFCMLFGLWTAGTVGQIMTFMPPEWRPRFMSIHPNVSNAAFGRIDLGNPATPNRGSQGPLSSVGSNVWNSLDGIAWPAYV